MKASIYFAAGTFAAALNLAPSCEPGLDPVRESTPLLRGAGAIRLRSSCGRRLDADGPYGVSIAAENVRTARRSLIGTYAHGEKLNEHTTTISRDVVAGANTIVAVATDEDSKTLIQSFQLGSEQPQDVAVEGAQNTKFNATCRTCDSREILCQDKCQNPPQTCAFYSSCAEAALPCGESGYAMGYGLKNCNKFMQRLSHFSVAGQAWIFRVMTCLQRFLIDGPLQSCNLDCNSLQAAAFGSHPTCYVDSGVCDLPIGDWVQLVITIRDDLLTLDTLKQAVTTGGGCLSHYLQEIAEEIQKLEDQLPHTPNSAKLLTEIAVLRSVRQVFE